MVETSDWEVGFTAAVPPHFELCLKYGREQRRKVKEGIIHINSIVPVSYTHLTLPTTPYV